MPARVRMAVAADLEPMAELAEAHQREPALNCPYVSEDAAAIASDIAGCEGWTDSAAVALGAGGALVGWLLGEADPDMGRVWWWGPYAPLDEWDAVADELYALARPALPASITEEEACGERGNDRTRRWSQRRAMTAEPASALLAVERRVTAPGQDAVRPMEPRDRDRVMALHASAFPGTHTPPAMLVAADKPRLVVERNGEVVGYAAVEMHNDGSGYLDFLAVDGSARRTGLGSALVAASTDLLFDLGATRVHLTVREANVAARRLYTRLGFVEEAILCPYRKGFTLPD